MSRAKPGRSAEWSRALAAVEKTRGALLFQEVYVGERRTSVRLDPLTRNALRDIAAREGIAETTKPGRHLHY